jgi:DNA polymerase (family 10)
VARANDVVAGLLEEYADLLAITGGEAFKARVYEKAARAVAGHHADVSGMDVKELQQVSGVGASIAEKIVEYFATGSIAAVEQLRAKIPEGVRALTTIPGLGPKKAMVLYEERGIASVDELVDALDNGRLAGLKGFGPKTEENMRHGIELTRGGADRALIDVASGLAEEIVAAISSVRGCERCTSAGSLRRMRETIGDIDILAAAPDPGPLMAAFASLPLVTEVIARGDKKTSVRTNRGLQVDLRVVPLASWGAALQYFTGSKQHNVRIREFAVRKGLKLSEYGLFRVDDGSLVVSETEEEVYQRLGLAWVPPTLREDRGEVDAALSGTLPVLLTERDIRGDLHTHTNLTDGVSTLEDMVAAAEARGLRYYAVTDHAKDMPMQRMTDAKMLAQREKVRALSPYGKVELLHGTELNIGPDGAVDWDADFLAGFDICVASVHSHFTQSAAEMTARLVRACENPYVNVIGHPTTRQLGRRPPVDAHWDEVFQAAARTGTAMEINSHPDRLDLPDELILRAKRFGVKFALNTDSHSTIHLGHLRFGVGMAQRAWLTKDDVITAWPLSKVRAFVSAKRRQVARNASRSHS